MPDYVELDVISHFSFLEGASSPEELVRQAQALGHRMAAICDTHSLAGIVRAFVAAREAKFPLVIGCRLLPDDGPAMRVYPTSRAAYGGLCRLLSLGKQRAPKGQCQLALDDVAAFSAGLLAIVEPPEASPPPPENRSKARDGSFERKLSALRAIFDGDRLSLAATCLYQGSDAERHRRLQRLAHRSGVPLVASGQVRYHTPQRHRLQDVLTCIRHGCTLDQAGFRLDATGERFLQSPQEMARRFAVLPGVLARSCAIAERARDFQLDQLRYHYPREPCPPGLSPAAHLRERVLAGARKRYPAGIPEKIRQALDHELALITELQYEAYFLTCYDLINFARARNILCQGRGGAANSAVCYCLGITEVDPARFSLLFERFISRERREPPDIDIDFEHERREEVIQHLFKRYGRERAAMTAEVIRYRGRSAVRDVGKVFGLSADAIDAIARNLDRWGEAPTAERIAETGLNPRDPLLQQVMAVTSELIGFPRHLSQHVGGMVLTDDPLCELVPIENAAMPGRTVIAWDKDDIDAVGLLKVDCLGLGMLTCLRKAFALLEEHAPAPVPRSIEAVMAQERPDDAVYAMISRADTLGVFQVESRAQMSMLPRMKPRTFYDLVIEVAIVRPGPIQGGMVHPYLRRRQGLEPVDYPRPEVQAVLERTLGVPLFQEQAMQLAIVAAGFSPDQADGLRRSMASWRKSGAIHRYGQQLVAGMIARGYPEDFARRCFEQIKGFGEYGFPESHAASFAILVYVSAWLKCHHPAVFAAALLNSQPMGFYAPAQILRDAREHGVNVLPVDVHHSAWDCTLEAGAEPGLPALRLGMRLVRGLAEAQACRIAEAIRQEGRPPNLLALWRQSGVNLRALRQLARADAFGSLGLDRQQALWQIRSLREEPLPLFEAVERLSAVSAHAEGLSDLPAIPPIGQVLHDYTATGLSLREHPMASLRTWLNRRGVRQASDLQDPQRTPGGQQLQIAGLVTSRQRPGTAKGVVFITLEDESGIANLIVHADVFDRYRRLCRLCPLLLVTGHLQRQGPVVHVHARHFENLSHHLPGFEPKSRDFH